MAEVGVVARRLCSDLFFKADANGVCVPGSGARRRKKAYRLWELAHKRRLLWGKNAPKQNQRLFFSSSSLRCERGFFEGRCDFFGGGRLGEIEW